MRSLSTGVLFFVAIVLFPAAIHAQVNSGPGANAKVEALKVAAVTGDDAGKEVDYAAERKEKPTIYVFVQADKWDRPVARFLHTLDQELAKSHNTVQIIAVWLTDDVEASKTYLPKAQGSLKLSQTTWTVFPGEKKGPAGWSINPDVYLTVVVAENQKVVASVAFRSVNETDVPAIVEKLKPAK